MLFAANRPFEFFILNRLLSVWIAAYFLFHRQCELMSEQ